MATNWSGWRSCTSLATLLEFPTGHCPVQVFRGLGHPLADWPPTCPPSHTRTMHSCWPLQSLALADAGSHSCELQCSGSMPAHPDCYGHAGDHPAVQRHSFRRSAFELRQPKRQGFRRSAFESHVRLLYTVPGSDGLVRPGACVLLSSSNRRRNIQTFVGRFESHVMQRFSPIFYGPIPSRRIS